MSRLVLDHRCNNVGVGGTGSFADYQNAVNSGNKVFVGRFNDGPQRAAYTEATGRDSCFPDGAAFKKLINQWGFALAPTAMHSARTTGFGGFHFSIEAVYSKINGDADYWKLGSEGPRDSSSGGASAFNKSPPGVVSQYSARVRKSFGFGLEVATTVGFVPSTSILTGGADARLALLEGFRTGFLGILPDVAVGAGVRTITGTPEFQLTTVGLDAQISKPLALASQSVLTPWIGYQYLWIFGDSGLIDTTPATDPVGYCNYAGQNLPGAPANPKSGTRDGQPICAGGSPIDFNNNVVFPNARLERQRMMFGANYRYEMVSFGTMFITDVVDPEDAQTGGSNVIVPVQTAGKFSGYKVISDKEALKGEPRQWSLVLELGAMF
ncbi:MAG TPA: hypothetical protein VHE30_00755 [Polyangiaceae bacterium]|nr:hypothetical protein [Polyangiaceae bacterium]